MAESFNDKVVFITGGGTGIGRATAKAFGKRGAQVIVTGLEIEPVNNVVDEIISDGGTAEGMAVDVTKETEISSAIHSVVKKYGRVDIALNNAGIEQAHEPLADTSSETFDQTIAVNLKGVFLATKYEIEAMLKNEHGSVVNISSGAGVKGFKDQAVYAASKHGVIGLSKSAALDYAHLGIRVNVVAPGIIDTPMMDRFTGDTKEGRDDVIAQEPVGRMGKPEEIAASVLYLSSDEAAFTTGAVLVVDGGQTI